MPKKETLFTHDAKKIMRGGNEKKRFISVTSKSGKSLSRFMN